MYFVQKNIQVNNFRPQNVSFHWFYGFVFIGWCYKSVVDNIEIVLTSEWITYNIVPCNTCVIVRFRVNNSCVVNKYNHVSLFALYSVTLKKTTVRIS